MYHDDAALARALETGAHGYVPKDAPPEDVVTAVRLVASGGLALSAQLAPRIPHLVAGGTARSNTSADSQFPHLSPRERQVLALLADNLPNSGIADRIGVSTKTVANYVSTICMRLGVPNRHAAAQLAQRARNKQH
jgi:DNA-binding NarL/FixJ family response regulator